MKKFDYSVFDINPHERRTYSQNGEDGIIEHIFSRIGTTNKFFVEFGVGDGSECNCRYLLEKKGWNGLMMDAGFFNETKVVNEIVRKAAPFLKSKKDHHVDVKNEIITAENVQSLFRKYNVPKEFDLLSIDIDYNDYWVWKAITDYLPRVVIIEYNSSVPPTESKVVPYDPKAKWRHTNYFGASLLALSKLASKKGYSLVGCDNNGVNAFFCRSSLVKGIRLKDISDAYRPPGYGVAIKGIRIGHIPSYKKMMKI